MSLPTHFTFNDGTRIPSIGMGCWMGAVGGGERVYDMCTKALKAGYRHFDTAAGYRNENEVGRALRDSGIPREDLYIVTKLLDHGNVQEAFQQSLDSLGCEYIDLYLMHWPMSKKGDRVLPPDESPTFVEAWIQMEKLLQTGKVKSIGVSNFSIKTLSILLPHCTVVPATNQVELHPCLPQEDLKEFCELKGILLTAYSPFGRSTMLFEHQIVKSIADKLGVTPAQVLLSWATERSTIVIPKSENEDRMKANLQLVALTEEDMRSLNSIHREPGMHKSLLDFHRADGSGLFGGWSYEWLGWNMIGQGIVKEA